MVAVDTSTLIAFLSDEAGNDVRSLDDALSHLCVLLPPVVLCEILSDPKLSDSITKIFLQIPLLALKSGYWERAGKNRSRLLAKGLKARLADTLIAQACIDSEIPLLTRDYDFRHFVKHCGLSLV